MAFSKSVALCLFLAIGSGFAREFAGQSSRKMLQSSNTTSVSPADAFTNAVSSGASTADIQAAFQKLIQSSTPQDQKSAITTALQKTSGNTATTSNLANAIADTSKSNPGLSTAIGTAVAGATGTPNTANTGTTSDATAILKVISSSGTSDGSITAVATAQASATDAIAQAVGVAIAAVQGTSASQGTITATANVCAQAIGTACATAITSVTAKGTVTGSGSVQGAGVSNAAAFAQAFSAAIAKAFALATNGKDQAVAEVQATSFTSAIANVCSSSEVLIDQQGRGTTQTSVTTIASSFEQAISTSIAKAVAFVAENPTSG